MPPAAEDLAHLPGELEVLELIGSGGMGAVYKARQRSLDRIVAVKVLPTEISADPAFAQRFTREAQSLARLSHPHIVAIYDFGSAGGLYYFVMEYVDGSNLRHLLDTGRLEPAEALVIVPQICDALQFAHDAGVVHRDIKPENILIDKRGGVKIADFGLARLLGQGEKEASLTETNQVLGTFHYMAPEQLQKSRGVDHRADIYSLGVVFYEMLTGEVPMGRFAPPSKKVQIDVRLDEVVLRSLETEPQLRYQQVSHIKSDLDGIRTGPAGTSASTVSVQAELAELIREKLPQGTIAAMRAYRERTGASLADAKAAVESVAHSHGVPVPKARLASKIAILVAVASAMSAPITLSILSKYYPFLKLDVSKALVGLGYLGWLAIFLSQAIRKRNTPQGWSAALILYANLVFVFLWLAGQTSTILTVIYDLTGATPGRSDRFLIAGFCLAQLSWIVPKLVHLAKHLRRVPVIHPLGNQPAKSNQSTLLFVVAGLTAVVALLSLLDGNNAHWLFVLISCNSFAFGLIRLPRVPVGE